MHLYRGFSILLLSLAFFSLSAQETNKAAETYYMDQMKYVENIYTHFEQYSIHLTAKDFDNASVHLDKLSTLGTEYLSQLALIEAYNKDSSLLKVVKDYVAVYVDGSQNELLRILNYNQNTYFTEEETQLANEASLRFTENSEQIVNHFNEVATNFYYTHVQLSDEIVFCNGLEKMLIIAENEFESIKGEKIPNTLFGISYYTTEVLPFTTYGTMISTVGSSAEFVYYRESDETEAVHYFNILEGLVDACLTDWRKTKTIVDTEAWQSSDGSDVYYSPKDFSFTSVGIYGTKSEGYYQVAIRITN